MSKNAINDILEMVTFIRDNAATKEDLEQLRSATKTDINQIRAEMATKEDIKQIRSEMATKKDLKKLDKRVGSLEKEMKEQRKEMQAHKKETKKQGKELKEITKQMIGQRKEMENQKLENRFFHSQMATKEDLKNYVTKDDMLNFKSEIIQHIDGFAIKINKYDAEISANRLSIDRLDTRMTKIETK